MGKEPTLMDKIQERIARLESKPDRGDIIVAVGEEAFDVIKKEAARMFVTLPGVQQSNEISNPVTIFGKKLIVCRTPCEYQQFHLSDASGWPMKDEIAVMRAIIYPLVDRRRWRY